MFPKAERITWITVFFAASFATVTLNAITIVIFIKHRNLRNRSAYLVINLAVADMLVGGVSTFDLSYFYGQICSLIHIYFLTLDQLLSLFSLSVP